MSKCFFSGIISFADKINIVSYTNLQSVSRFLKSLAFFKSNFLKILREKKAYILFPSLYVSVLSTCTFNLDSHRVTLIKIKVRR